MPLCQVLGFTKFLLHCHPPLHPPAAARGELGSTPTPASIHKGGNPVLESSQHCLICLACSHYRELNVSHCTVFFHSLLPPFFLLLYFFFSPLGSFSTCEEQGGGIHLSLAAQGPTSPAAALGLGDGSLHAANKKKKGEDYGRVFFWFFFLKVARIIHASEHHCGMQTFSQDSGCNMGGAGSGCLLQQAAGFRLPLLGPTACLC